MAVSLLLMADNLTLIKMHNSNLSIALMTPIYNPTQHQIDNLVHTYKSLDKVISCFYVAINSRSTNIKAIKK